MSRLRLRIYDRTGRRVSEREFTAFPVLIGRDEQAQIRLDDQKCSRSHARIELREEDLWYVDQKSTNGSFATDGKRLTEIKVGNPLRVRIGSLWLELAEMDVTLIDHSIPALPDLEFDARLSPIEEPRSFETPLVVSPPPLPVRVSVEPEQSVELERVEARAVPATAQKWADGFPSDRDDRVRDRPDFVDRAIRAASHSLTLLLSLLVFGASRLAVGVDAVEETLFGSAVIGVGLGVVALFSAILTLGFGRIFEQSGQRPTLGRTWVAYLNYGLLVLACHQISDGIHLAWPEGTVFEPIQSISSVALFFLFLLFNLRWVWGVGTKWSYRVSALLGFAILLLGVTSALQFGPRWQRVAHSAELTTGAGRVPASLQVTEKQFIRELGESLARVSERNSE